MKTALVTGGNKGIGFELVEKLLEMDYRVIALSKEVTNLSSIENPNLEYFEINLLDTKKLANLLEALIEKENIDVLINNAGMGLFKKIEEYCIEEWKEVIELNLIVPFILINKLVHGMKERGFGRIINIGSDADTVPFPEASAYCASKYGLRGMTESIRLDLKKTNVNITTISPGRVDTYFNGKYPGCRPNSLKASDVANQVLLVLQQEGRCNIEHIKMTSSNE